MNVFNLATQRSKCSCGNSPHRLEVSQSLHECLLSDVPGKTAQEHLGREATARVQAARW